MSKQKLLVKEFLSIILRIRKIVDHSFAIPLEDKIATMLQMHALSFLRDHPNSTVGQLSQTLHLSSSSIAQLSDRLYNIRLINRINDKEDRRVVRLNLTEKGEKHLQKMKKIIEKKMEYFFGKMSEKDLAEVVRIFSGLLKNIEEKK